MSESSLRHLSGLAEVRLALEAEACSWQRIKGEKRHDQSEADAVWASPWGEAAVEYDAGSYRGLTVMKKGLYFRNYGFQVWGAASAQRLRFIQDVLRDQGIELEPVAEARSSLGALDGIRERGKDGVLVLAVWR